MSDWKQEKYDREIARLEDLLRLAEDERSKALATLAQIREIVAPDLDDDDLGWDDE